jgi:hypothetical protein
MRDTYNTIKDYKNILAESITNILAAASGIGISVSATLKQPTLCSQSPFDTFICLA